LKAKLADKVSRYTDAGWWVPAMVQQAVPMVYVPKKSTRLRTIFDLQIQNDNMEKDISPFPDQDAICNDVACVPYRSKLDISEAYEQIHIVPEDVHKTTFTTIFGTFVSQVMQQGDCNALLTFQQLMTSIFCDLVRPCIPG